MSLPSVPRGLACAVVLSLSLAAASGTAYAQSRPQVRMEAMEGEYVTLGRANLRQQPSQQGARLGQIDAGATVRVTGKVADAPWYAVVAPDGRNGYVFADLLRAATPEPAAPAAPAAPATTTPPAASASPAEVPPAAPAAAATTVGDALTRRLDAMEATLNSISDRIKAPAEAMQGMAAQQQALQKAVEALRADIAGLRNAAVEGDKPGGLIDRLLKVQEQISAQIAEQRKDVGELAQRLDRTEEWLKPLGDWSEQTWSKVRQESRGWSGWLWDGYAGMRSWLTEGWWWQAPAAPSAPVTPAPSSLRLPSGRTVLGELET